jgi:hypothetical protein
VEGEVRTLVGVLEPVLEARERGAKGLGELEEDLVEHQDALLSQVSTGRVEDSDDVRRKIASQIRGADVGKAGERKRVEMRDKPEKDWQRGHGTN